jgi:hypothetical protein
MAAMMASMNLVGAQTVTVALASSTSAGSTPSTSAHVSLGSSAARFGGLRLNVAHCASSARAPVRSTVLVRAEEGVVDKVENAVGGAAEKVKDTAVAAKDKVQDAAGRVGDFVSGKADEAQDAAEDVSRDVQKNADKAGNKAADAGRDLEGSAKNASRDARGEADNIVVSSKLNSVNLHIQPKFFSRILCHCCKPCPMQ